MRYFFIDLENVRSAGLEGVLSLDSEDMVYIFYSENANNLTIPTLENINNSKAKVKFINTNYVGSNAMDFQIVSLLGAMIERNKRGFFAIISHDNGFKSALTFCERYFTDYDIRVGEFENIISAITYEIKHSAGSNENGKASIKKKNKPERGNNSSKNNQKDNSENIVIKGRRDNKNADNVQGSSAASQPGEEQTEKKTTGKKQKNNKKNNTQNNTQSNSQDKASGVVGVSSDMGYIYDHLKDLLSERTIDVYASKIHEALLIVNSKDELHKFFKEKCGDDEGEALYKLIQSDFENLKRKARK